MAPLDWRAALEGFSRVMKLVQLAARKDMVDEETIRSQLLKQGRLAYENELMLQAQRVGCPGRRPQLTNGPILSELNGIFDEHAKSIVNTYNYDLVAQIQVVRANVPRANRHTYAKRLRLWDSMRAELKDPVISQVTENVARSLAQEHFYIFNGHDGAAVLKPVTAVCPVCQGWIERGEVPMAEAMNHPPPYHVRCPHLWETHPDKRTQGQCEILWMGE